MGDICYVYRLPEPIGDRFVNAIKDMGELRELQLKRNTIWTLESEEGFTFSMRSGATEVEVRFKRKRHDENLVQVENWLKSYFGNIEILEEA